MKKLIFILMILIMTALYASTATAATTHNYICSDFGNIGGGASCNANSITMPPGGSYAIDSSRVFDLGHGSWYVSFTYSGSGTQGRIICDSNTVPTQGDFCNSAPNSQYFTESLSDHLLYTSIEPSGTVGIYLRNDSVSGTFTLSNICVSDTVGSCINNGTTTNQNITGSGTANRLTKFITPSTIGDSLFSDDGFNTVLTNGNLFLQIGSLIDTVSAGNLNFGTTNATSITLGKLGVTASIPGTISWKKASTIDNCSSSSSPAVCGSAPSGSVAMAVGGSTLVVNTAAVTDASQILITEDSSLGQRLGITCNTNTNRNYSVNARVPGVSFTIKSNINPNNNKACLSYWIIN